MKPRNILKYLFYFYASCMPLLFLSFIFFAVMLSSSFNITLLVVCFLIFYGVTIVKAVCLFGFLSLYVIYLYTSIFFIYGKLIGHILGYGSFLRSTWPVVRTFTERTGLIFIIIAFLSHYIIDIIFCYHYKSAPKNNLVHYPGLESCGFFMMFISFPALLYKLYLNFLFIREYGYISIYNGKIDDLHFPFWTAGAGTVFIIGYLFVLTSYPNKKKFIISSLFFIMAMLASSLKGGRTTFLVALVLTLYLYSKFYQKKIKLKKIAVVVIISLLFTLWMGIFRNTTNGPQTKNITVKPSDVFTLFFVGNSGSITVPLLIIEEYGNWKYRHYPFIFYPFLHHIYPIIYPTSGQTRTFLEKYNSIGGITIHKMDPGAFFNGNGLGGSVLAEMYDCGALFGVIVWSVFLVFFILAIEKKMLIRNTYIALFWLMARSIPNMARNSLFGFFIDIHWVILSYCFIRFINFLCFPQKINNLVLKGRSILFSKDGCAQGFNTL